MFIPMLCAASVLKALCGVLACVEINQCAGRISRRWRGRPGSVKRRETGIATPSSRRRVDDVENDAMIQTNAP